MSVKFLGFFGVLFLFAFFVSAFACAASFNTTQLVVGTESGYGISNFAQAPDRIFPQDQVVLKMDFFTTKAEGATDVIVTTNTPFLSTDSAYSFGNLKQDEIRSVTLSFTVPSTTKAGTYTIYVYAKDANSPQKEVARIELVVNEPTFPGLLVANARSNAPIRTGGNSIIDVSLTNTGVLDAEDISVDIASNESKPFTPLEYDRKYVQKIAGGETVTIPFSVGVSSDASPGFYPLTVNINYQVDKVSQPTLKQKLGLKVESNAELLLTSDQSQAADGSTTLALTLANVGDTAVRGVYVKASSKDFRIQGASDKFIGTLNLDDSSNVALSLSPLQGKVQGIVTVLLSYKDALNQDHSSTQDINVGFSGGFQGNSTAGQTPAGGGGQRFIRQRGDQGIFLGLNLLQLGLAAVLLLVVGFFGFKWYKGRKKK